MLTTLLIFSLLVFSSTQWIMLWIYLEGVTLAMCYLLSKDLMKKKYAMSPVATYYSIQILSSLLIMFSVYYLNTNNPVLSNLSYMLSVLMKMGFWPFHNWYLKMIKSLESSFNSLWVLMTYQKAIPIFLLLFSNFDKNCMTFLFTLSVVNLLVSLTSLKNGFSKKEVLGFSSMNNNSWLMIILLFHPLMVKTLLVVYSVSLVLLLYFFSTKNNSLYFLLVMNIGGIPPMPFFWVKVMFLKILILMQQPKEILVLLMLSACYVTFFYIFMILQELLELKFKQ